ncbi:hypothetical protein Pmar_PMAR023533 [Perkinsus marinus ATCC 50983]|uniref:Uncharacterized protein n=1 Tax=Perkinsus marinus (strain ATCC 50983 / TXsc) TaxID=423536 RepID=C5KCL7_PERM5|nr:hypothetical protein Pmar_PMAR023533 [Perkinsus marinus ATCC 50983]EER17616.1 hypothetical protein Pmar_PMAR023533 [Perkinsus marinus ATCC 50983]|eukprot:XP_002785820.1 hypothetical protein Pmar_PMAR023533 [Perkinsus marinus ATCC 50983]
MAYNEKANEALTDALKRAQQKNAHSQGRYLSFDIQNASRRNVSDDDLVEYCNMWYNKERDKFEDGWRPEIGTPTDTGGYGSWQPDRSGIMLLSSTNSGSYGIKIQGRVESVRAMGVIGAGFALQIPAQVAMVCPAASMWWDWLEKLGLIRDRPPATRVKREPIEKGKNSKYRGYYQDDTAITSIAVKNYTQALWTERCRAQVEYARKDMEIRRPDWKDVEGQEAQQQYEVMFEKIRQSYRGESYIRAELDFGLHITTGNVLWYCTQIWPDAVLDRLGTRWRPRFCAVARRNYHDSRYQGDKGGVYIADETHKAVACIGSPALCRAVMPILAAIAAGIPNARMVAQNAPQFDIFWEYVGWNKNMPPPEAPNGKPGDSGKWRDSRAYDDENNRDDTFMAQLFKQENDALLELQWYNAGEYHRTNGMWCGGECIPGVSWSRDDFVDNLMLWWGDAVVEEVGKFRYRPNFMDKGGLVLDIGGAWTSVQSKEIWAQSMMCMLSSIMCGIPGEIAALLPASDPFWDFIVDKEGPELPSSEGTSESSRPRGGVLENEAPGGPQRGQEGPGRASTIVEEMKSSKKKSKDTTEKPGTPMRPPVVVATSRSPEAAAYPSSICTDSTAPSASEGRDVREYSGVVTAAIDYDHAEEGVARMRRGERFHCKRQTKNLFLGYKEGSKELLWLPKFVVTGDLTTLRRE